MAKVVVEERVREVGPGRFRMIYGRLLDLLLESDRRFRTQAPIAAAAAY